MDLVLAFLSNMETTDQIVSHQEIIDFIFSQPREKEIFMWESIANNDETCGCLLVQLARHKGVKGRITAGFNTFGNQIKEFRLEKSLREYVPFFGERLTYGELQDYLIGKKEKISDWLSPQIVEYTLWKQFAYHTVTEIFS